MQVKFDNLNQFLEYHQKCPLCGARTHTDIDWPISVRCQLTRSGLQFYSNVLGDEIFFINIFNNSIINNSYSIRSIIITQFCKKFHFSYTGKFKIINDKVKKIKLIGTYFYYHNKDKEKISISSNLVKKNTIINLIDNVIELPLIDFKFSKKIVNKKIKKLKVLI